MKNKQTRTVKEKKRNDPYRLGGRRGGKEYVLFTVILFSNFCSLLILRLPSLHILFLFPSRRPGFCFRFSLLTTTCVVWPFVPSKSSFQSERQATHVSRAFFLSSLTGTGWLVERMSSLNCSALFVLFCMFVLFRSDGERPCEQRGTPEPPKRF